MVTNWSLMTVSYPLLVLLIIKAVKDDDDKEVDEEVEEKSKVGAVIPAIEVEEKSKEFGAQ